MRVECTKRPPRFVTAHYGVSAARGFSTVAPVPVVASVGAAAEARARLAQLHDAAGCPVGVENLGIAFSADDVRRQAEMMHAILDGEPEHFFLLDVHNLYCQATNYGFSLTEILALYPLERVRELHVSGGSWWEVPGASTRFRRDTHDQAVPDAVFELLGLALAHAPHVELVCFERFGGTMPTVTERLSVRADYLRTVETVRAASGGRALTPTPPRALPPLPTSDAREFESAFVMALCTAADAAAVRTSVGAAFPERAAWLAAIDERALHAAMTFERRWAKREP